MRKYPKGVNPIEAIKIAQWVQSHEVEKKVINKLPSGIAIEQIMAWFIFEGWVEDDKAKLGWKRGKK